MSIFAIILTIAGLVLFEVISSIDNAIINAEVLSTMGKKARRWFLIYGLFIAVFVIRGLLPFLIVWAIVGFVFAGIVFAISVVSMPMMLDRGADTMESIGTSAITLWKNQGAMLLWALSSFGPPAPVGETR